MPESNYRNGLTLSYYSTLESTDAVKTGQRESPTGRGLFTKAACPLQLNASRAEVDFGAVAM